MLNVQIKDENYFLINLYGPNKDAEAVRFYQDLSTTLRGVDFDSDSNVIVGGVFNCPLDPTLDKKGGILIPRQHVINSIESFQNEFSLHDIWRNKNPNTRSYTWSNSGSVLVPGQPSTNSRKQVRITTRVRRRLYLDCRNYNPAWL